jgi:hypothetical protein
MSTLPPLQFLEGLLTVAYAVVQKAVGEISSPASRASLRVSTPAPTRTAHARAPAVVKCIQVGHSRAGLQPWLHGSVMPATTGRGSPWQACRHQARSGAASRA